MPVAVGQVLRKHHIEYHILFAPSAQLADSPEAHRVALVGADDLAVQASRAYDMHMLEPM